MACHKNDKIYDSLSYEIRILIFCGYMHLHIVGNVFDLACMICTRINIIFVPCDLVEIREEIMKVIK